MLETTLHWDNCFVPLTYSEEELPSDGSLRPRHLQLFFKRLRKLSSVRFYGVGEYGDQTWRPHYHAALFGYPECSRGSTSYNRQGQVSCCDSCARLGELWGRGRIHCGSLTTQSAAYVAGYVTKKMTKADDPRLAGREPEFARMSLRPGIGAHVMDEVASTLLEHGLENQLEDVPVSLRHGTNTLPLGRYLRRRLRERIGRSPNAPEAVLERMEEDLRDLRSDTFSKAAVFQKQEAFRQAVIERNMPRIRQIEGRRNIYKKGRVL